MLSLLAGSGSQVFAHEEEVILVGRSGAGEIQIDSDFAQPVKLPPSIFPGISGYATGELGIHSQIQDQPDEDFFQLSTAADFRLVLLAKDPGMEMWNDNGSGYLATNEMFFVGHSPFDTHPVWNLVNGTPGNSYSLTMKFHDLNGIYPDSAPFTVSFSPPDPLINLTPMDSQHAMLFWSTNTVGWMLESAESLGATNWNPLTNAALIAGSNFSLTISTSEAQQFFRLGKPPAN